MNFRKFVKLLLRLNKKKNATHPIEKIRRVVPEASESDAEQIIRALSISMTSVERLWALLKAVDYLEEAGISGDFVECGVWRGGSSFLMASRLAHRGSFTRKLWLYDTFEGMVQPTEDDIRSNGRSAYEMLKDEQENMLDSLIWAIASEDDVRRNLAESSYPEDLLIYVKGDVCKTLLEKTPKRIALLRLDTDWYESTKCEIDFLIPLMAEGGVVIIDDYGDWQGSKKAVDEYLESLDRSPLVHRLDYTGRSWVVGV